jgi:hypothetical protein
VTESSDSDDGDFVARFAVAHEWGVYGDAGAEEWWGDFFGDVVGDGECPAGGCLDVGGEPTKLGDGDEFLAASVGAQIIVASEAEL